MPRSDADHAGDPMAMPDEHDWSGRPFTVHVLAVLDPPMSGEREAGVKSEVAGSAPGLTNNEDGGRPPPSRWVPAPLPALPAVSQQAFRSSSA